MLRHVAGFGIALALAGCTEQVLLNDVLDDAGAGGAADAKDGTGGPPQIDASCAYYAKMTFSARAAQLVVALDRSSAMQGSFSGSTRQDAAVTAILNAVGTYQSHVQFGYEQFPADSSDGAYSDCQRNSCCAGSVIVPPQIYAGLSMSGALECGSPQGRPCPSSSYDSASNAALAKVLDSFKKAPQSNDDRYILLVTGSEPSCSSLPDGSSACSDAVAAASTLGSSGVRIVVLAVGYQPDDRSCLRTISLTGSKQPLPPGTDALYVASTTSSLNSALSSFVGAVARTACTLDASEWPPPSQAQLQLSLGGSPVSKVDSPDQNGWSYEKNSDRTAITFSGTACDQFLGSQQDHVTAYYTCSLCGGSGACPWLQP